MSATMTMEIPVDILESARMSLGDAKLELALALFAACRLSLGKAAELAGLSVSRFQAHLGAREMGPHYSIEDALDDRVALSSLR
jgi:predicted HTH domain antitoxin